MRLAAWITSHVVLILGWTLAVLMVGLQALGVLMLIRELFKAGRSALARFLSSSLSAKQHAMHRLATSVVVYALAACVFVLQLAVGLFAIACVAVGGIRLADYVATVTTPTNSLTQVVVKWIVLIATQYLALAGLFWLGGQKWLGGRRAREGEPASNQPDGRQVFKHLTKIGLRVAAAVLALTVVTDNLGTQRLGHWFEKTRDYAARCRVEVAATEEAWPGDPSKPDFIVSAAVVRNGWTRQSRLPELVMPGGRKRPLNQCVLPTGEWHWCKDARGRTWGLRLVAQLE